MKIIKKILITNDDGYKAVGINLLKKILINYSEEVYTVAPLVNQSGAGRSITLGTQIKYNKISNSDWVVHGTPTDAIIFALNKIFIKDKPDFVFSGINAGSNVGDEISYSGTVGAAFEGALRGIPSVALSQAGGTNEENTFEVSKSFLPIIMTKLSKIFSDNSLLYNINFPNCDKVDVKGMSYTNCAHQKISDELIVNSEESFFKIGKMNIIEKKNIKNDYLELKNNNITMTPLSINLTHKNCS